MNESKFKQHESVLLRIVWMLVFLVVWYLAMAIATAIFIWGAFMGTYHAGVEWGFWPGPATCSGSAVDLGSAGSLLERLETVKVIRCDEVQWRFLGLSLAGYNVLISNLMALIALWGIVRMRGARPA